MQRGSTNTRGRWVELIQSRVSPQVLQIETVPLVSLENTQRFKPMFEPGKVSFIQDSVCWRGVDVMGDRPGSLKLGSFKLLDVGGREPWCPGRGCILSDAALCNNVDCSQILLLPTPGRTAHDTKEVGSPKHLLAHLFDLGAEGHTTIVCYAQERRRRGAARWDPIDGNLGSPLCLSVV